MELGKDILVADAGGTSTRWSLISPEGYLKRDLHAAPINLCLQNDYELMASIKPVDVLISSSAAIYFYGAGCAGSHECERVERQIREMGFQGELQVSSDMLGAARSLLGNQPGVVCILGTGSNSCLYDGENVVDNVPPCGYILGDEGSGAAIGKRFMKYLLRNQLPEQLTEKFMTDNHLTAPDIYDKVYRQPRANAFLASTTTFIYDYINEPSIRGIVETEFDDFIGNIVSRYKGAAKLPIAFIGSVAYYFGHILRTVASRYGLSVSRIERNPMRGLLKYHNANYNPA